MRSKPRPSVATPHWRTLSNWWKKRSGPSAPIQRFADRVSNWFVPIVVSIAVVTMGIWLLTGSGFGRAAQAIAVLVIACPCALGIAVPAAVMIGSGAGQRNILVKTAQRLNAFRMRPSLRSTKPAH